MTPLWQNLLRAPWFHAGFLSGFSIPRCPRGELRLGIEHTPSLCWSSRCKELTPHPENGH
eukprot:5563661-Pyramimonas_sp.AAC.1